MFLIRFKETPANFRVSIKGEDIKVERITEAPSDLRKIENKLFRVIGNNLYKFNEPKWEEVLSMTGKIKEVDLIGRTVIVTSKADYISTFDLDSGNIGLNNKYQYYGTCLYLGNQVSITELMIKISNMKGEILLRNKNPVESDLKLIKNNHRFISFEYEKGLVLWIHGEKELRVIKFSEIE